MPKQTVKKKPVATKKPTTKPKAKTTTKPAPKPRAKTKPAPAPVVVVDNGVVVLFVYCFIAITDANCD